MWWLRELGGDLCERVMLQWLHTYYTIQAQKHTRRLIPEMSSAASLFWVGYASLLLYERNPFTRDMQHVAALIN